MVQMVSAVSGHRFNVIRERLAEKLELIKFDPWSEYLLTILSQKNFLTALFSFQFNKNLFTERKRRFAACKNLHSQGHLKVVYNQGRIKPGKKESCNCHVHLFTIQTKASFRKLFQD